jgi:ATP adenylyltransferase
MNSGFASGTLTLLVERAVEIGHQSGALVPIATDLQVVVEGDLRFPVRVLGHVDKKLADPTTTATSGSTNPFLPYDPNLFVGDVSQTHACLLNKYPIIEGHLLVVTRSFQEQETILNQSDFRAAWRCLSEVDGVVFYNSGPVAGASQPHKHMQLIPHPPEPHAASLPLTRLFRHGLPFKAAHVVYDRPQVAFDETFAGGLQRRYVEMLQSLGLLDPKVSTPKPYNLLMTREFMMVVPRRAECVEEMSINAMGFMGSIFVRDQAQLKRLLEFGIVNALEHAAGKA